MSRSIFKVIFGAVMFSMFSAGAVRAQSYDWAYWAGEQGSFTRGSNTADNPSRVIRFINLEYTGPSEFRLWKKCFLEAAALYKKEGITHPAGSDGNFFEVGGLTNTKKRILGWYDDKSGQHGFVVITAIENGIVYYTDNNAKEFSVGATPGNFVQWKFGYESGDWGPGITNFVAVQLWKHKGKGSPNAGCAFRFRQSGRI